MTRKRPNEAQELSKEEPAIEIEESKSKANGDPTMQAVLRLKEHNGRERSIRGRPRTSREDAQRDADEMKEAYMTGGAVALRAVQTKQRLTSRS